MRVPKLRSDLGIVHVYVDYFIADLVLVEDDYLMHAVLHGGAVPFVIVVLVLTDSIVYGPIGYEGPVHVQRGVIGTIA